MSMIYWGVVMYGVKESELKPGNKTFREIWEERGHRNWFTVNIYGERRVLLCLELGHEDDDCYLGYVAGYPWNIYGTDDATLLAEDVEEAVARFLEQYGYDRKDVIHNCEEINEVNCG